MFWPQTQYDSRLGVHLTDQRLMARIFFQDLRFAARQLIRSPGFAFAAILSLTLGIGATVSVFSVIYAVLLHPWPYRDSSHIVQLYLTDPSGRDDVVGLRSGQIDQLRQSSIFSDVVALRESYLGDTGGEYPDDVDVVAMTGNAFPFFGVPALLGRTFGPADQTSQLVTVLTYQYWQRRFQGRAEVVGQTLYLDHKPYTIVGVMPRSFTWMDPDVYVPLDTSSSVGSCLTVMRLRPGTTQDAATGRAKALVRQFALEQPQDWPSQYGVEVRRIGEIYTRPLGATLYALFGVVSLLLAIACGNVSILLLARGADRRREFAIRAALGASRARIVRQMLTEALLLSIAGCLLGTTLAWRAVGFVARWMPFQLFTRGITIPIHMPALFFSLALTLFITVSFALLPALHISYLQTAKSLQSATHRQAGNVQGRRLHAALIGAQIALALLLLAIGGAAVRSFEQLTHANLGFDPANTTDYPIPIHIHAYADWAARAAYIEQLRQKVAQTSGVDSVSLALIAPPSSVWDFPVEISGRTFGAIQYANVDFVDPEYFAMLRIPVLQGRLWTQPETVHGARLAVVNQTFAKLYFSPSGGLGRSVRIPWLTQRAPRYLTAEGSDSWLQIIGVVGDVPNGGLDQPVKPAVYTPYSLYMTDWVQLLVRSLTPASVQEQTIRREIAAVNASQQVSDPVESIQTHIERQPEWSRGRLVSILAGTFSALSLLLAAIGLYSVVAYSVAQRTSEFGIRMAMGADRLHILAAALKSVSLSIMGGCAAGITLSLTFGRIVAHKIASSAPDPLVAIAACCLLLGTAALACLLPAWRATRVEPNTALRQE
jgi:predicted permease